MAEYHHYQLLFHPPGVIRLITPAEEAAMQREPRIAARPERSRVRRGAHPSISRTTRALRRLANTWVSAQLHRGGI